MRCLSKITDTQGNEFNLMQINDFSVITSEIQGKGVAETRIYQQSSHSVPSWISVQGDKIFSVTTMSSDEKFLVNDDYTLIAYNHITVGGDNFYGTAMYNKLNSNARAGGGGDSNPSSYGLDQWLGIVLDDENQRAYLIFATDKYGAGSNNYYRVYVETGNYNETDIYWETFGEVVLNQSAGGGGYYGGYIGGAGSGYIGNSLLSNKKMVGYNVPTSEAENTKTESVNEASESPVSGKPKIGNGFARIKFLDDVLAILKLETYGTVIYGQFNIPSKNVQNKTVVAKANGVPANITDGIAFSLSSYDGNPFRMKGFSANTHYYFVIFDETPNASRSKSNVMDIITPASVNVLMDSDSRYIDNAMLDYSIVNQSTLSQNWYHYDSSNVYYYKNNYYNSGHSYLIFDNVINTGSYKYICVDAEIFDGSVPSAADQHWNYLAGAIVLASDGIPVCQTSYDSVTNAHKTIYMARWDEFIPANNKDWLTTGKLPRYMIKIPINDIPNTDIRLVIFSCDAKNRVYGVLLEG